MQAQIDGKFAQPDLLKLSESLLDIKNRNWIQDLVVAHQQFILTSQGNSFEALVKHKRLIQLREQFHWLVWAIAYQYFHCPQIRKSLPKQESSKWSDGFSYKGLHIQLLPIEDAQHIDDEINALAQVQLELMQLQGQNTQSKLVKQLTIPLIATVKCGAFMIYSVPIMFALEPQKDNSPSLILTSSPKLDQNVNLLVQQHLSLLQINGQNSVELSYFSQMPVLKHLQPKNLITIADCDKTDPDFYFFVVDAKQCLRTLASSVTSSQLFIMPNSNEEIIFRKYPSTNQIELKKIRKLLLKGDSASTAIGSMKPKGDVNCSPTSSPNQSQEQALHHENYNEEVKTHKLSKNGWTLVMIQLESLSKTKQSENRRASQLLNLSKSSIKHTTTGKESSGIYGPCLVNASLVKGFRVLPAMQQTAYPQGIESQYQSSIEQVVKVLNTQFEKVLSINALKALMHRKGLNMRFLWLILPKLILKKARNLVMIAIILRVMKQFVYQKTVQKCLQLIDVPFHNASSSEQMKESVAIFTNAVLKNKFAKYKTVFDETLLGLFLHRLQVHSLAFTLELNQTELNYLESRDILDQIIEAPSLCPTLFLNSLQTYFDLRFTQEFQRQYQQDSVNIVSKPQPVCVSDFQSVEMQVRGVLSLKEQAFYILARRMSQDNVRNSKGTLDTQRQKFQEPQQLNTYRNFKNFDKPSHAYNLIDLSKKKVNCELILPPILYKVNSNSILQAKYTLPSVDQLNEWVMVLDSLLKDCFSICFDNSDQVLVEALCLQALSTFLLQDDLEGGFKILQRIMSILQECLAIAPEILSTVTMISGLWSDQSAEVELVESERNYIASMLSLMSVQGDPRGRGNSGLPIMMFYVWKLQILAQAGKKTQDSELAEEMFDACLHGFVNYQLAFKQQTQQAQNAQSVADGDNSQFNLSYKINDYQKQFFDLSQYKHRSKNVLQAGGFLKSSVKYIKTEEKSQSTKKLYLRTGEADLSDVEINIEPNYSALANEVESVPFPNWMINRQVFQQQLKTLVREKPQDQKEMLTQLIRETLNSLHSGSLLSWLVTVNPINQQSGQQWDSQKTKEFCFGQQNQMYSSSGSSAAYSQSGRSLNSSRFEGSQSTRRRHLGSYTQIFARLNKAEVSGSLYIWGTDMAGQLGLDQYCAIQKQSSISSGINQYLKVLHPRVCVPLKDEVIKEICCGYAFTFAINQYGQTFCWGSNDCAQLGLGPESLKVPIVRSPTLNPHLNGIVKITAGNEHAMALTKSGELYIWGSAMLTGLNDKENRCVPTTLEQLSSNNVKQIACGGLHSIVLTKQGQIYTWGSNEGGQLGLDLKANQDCVQTPTLVDHLVRNKQFVISIAGGETHSLCLTREHKVWGWGMSMYGQLGLGFSADSFEPGIGLSKSKVAVPTNITPYIPQNADITQLYCGAAFTLMLGKEGELYGCGINDLGQLGLDTFLEDMSLAMMDRTLMKQQSLSSDVCAPSKVICFEKMNVQAVACGENHSLAIIGEDRNMLWSWGMYKNGQLGLGEVTMKMNPRPIQTLCGGHIHQIAAGSQHSVALLGQSQQLSQLTQNFFTTSDMLNNPWIIDFRALDIRRKINTSQTHAKRGNLI